MTTATAGRNGPFAVVPGTRLLGEIITWSCPGIKVKHLDLVNALKEAGLDEGLARDLAPRHAFSRACKKLSEARIIRQVAEDDRHLTFQFTSETKEGDRFAYALETLLTLDKESGTVSCPLAGLATLAQEELDAAIEARTGGDVTRVVQRLFERKADLFPIRPQGGCYFVPQQHADFVDRVQSFLGAINGTMGRFPVPSGTAEGDRSVKEAVAGGLAALVKEHAAAVEGFGEDTREDTLRRAAEKIRTTKFKIESYSAYLAEERTKLERELALASAKLREKVGLLAPSRDGVTTGP